MVLTPITLLIAFILGLAVYHAARLVIEDQRVAAGALPTRGEFVEESDYDENRHTIGYIISGLLMALILVLTNNLVAPMGTWDVYGMLLNGAVILFFAVGLMLSWIDASIQKLPSKIIYYGQGAVLALLVAAAISRGSWELLIPMAVGGVMYFLFYFLVWFLKPSAFGFGDVRLSFFIGATLTFLSPASGFVGFASAWILALIGIIIGTIFGTVRSDSKIAFGPWMVLGAAVGLFYGGPIVTMMAL